MIVKADLLKTIDSNKVIPIIRQQGTHNVPTFLKTKLFISFSSVDQVEYAFDELLRTLHGAPLFKKPPIGDKPFVPVADSLPEKRGDPVLELMRAVVADFEAHANGYMKYAIVLRKSGVSRIMFDVLVEKAKCEGLILQDGDGDLHLRPKARSMHSTISSPSTNESRLKSTNQSRLRSLIATPFSSYSPM